MLTSILKKKATSLPIHYKPNYENMDIETFFQSFGYLYKALKRSDLGSGSDLSTCFYSKLFQETE
jgi:hypothetical protein